MEYEQERNGWLVTLGQFFAWVIASLGTIADVLYIRGAFTALLTVLDRAHAGSYARSGGIGPDITFGFQLSALDQGLIFILSLVAVSAVIAIEYYFRKGRPQGLLFQRIGKVFGIELGIIVVSILINLVA